MQALTARELDYLSTAGDLAGAALMGGRYGDDETLTAYLQDLAQAPQFKPCLCAQGPAHPHRPGSATCRLRGTALARVLNRYRHSRAACRCGAYSFPHQVGGGKCECDLKDLERQRQRARRYT